MTMTAEPISVPSVVLMTRDEAQACIERIKSLAEDVAALLIDLRDREGWRALGYATWQDCIRDEFHMSRSYAHRLINAHLVERALTLPVGNIDHLPERHARELVPLLDEPDKMQAALEDAVATAGDGKLRADHVHDAVDRQMGRPARQAKAKPARRSVSSGADASDRQDVPDDDSALGYQPDSDVILDVNNEPYADTPGARKWCQDCGDHYRGAHECPMADYPAVAEQPCTGCGGEIVVLSEQDDLARARSINEAMAAGRPIVQLCERCLTGEDAPTDQPADAEAMPDAAESASVAADDGILPPVSAPVSDGGAGAAEMVVADDASLLASAAAVAEADSPSADATSAPPADPEDDDDVAARHQQVMDDLDRERAAASPAPSRNGTSHQASGSGAASHSSVSTGAGSKRVPSSRAFSGPTLDAGDLTRVLLDMPTADVVEAIAENATPAQLAALRHRIGAAPRQPEPSATPEPMPAEDGPVLRAGSTIKHVVDAVTTTYPLDGQVSLAALLTTRLPESRQGALVTRVITEVTDLELARNLVRVAQSRVKVLEVRAEHGGAQ